jgi:carbohydrate binding protein with CBM11 domain
MRFPTTNRWWTLCALGALTLTQTGAYSLDEAETSAATVPPLILEDFEAAALSTRPYLWKNQGGTAVSATVGAEKAELDGVAANKALKFEYAFGTTFDASHGVETGPGGQPLPGSLTGISMMVFGDNSKNAIALRVKDKAGETFEWQIPVAWTGWKKVLYPMNPRTAARGGTRANGAMDLPISLDLVRVARVMGGARKGEMMIDNLTAVCDFGKVATLYDTAGGVKLDGWTAKKNRSLTGNIADSLVPRGGKDVAVLKFEYAYENAADSSVEFSKTIPAGDGHGTLIAEVFGDGSNNVLRFRMLDGQDHVWQGTWANVLVDWSGWKTLYIDTRTLKDPAAIDPNAVMEKFPTKFYSLIIDDCSASDRLPGVESGRAGEIYLGRLMFASAK